MAQQQLHLCSELLLHPQGVERQVHPREPLAQEAGERHRAQVAKPALVVVAVVVAVVARPPLHCYLHSHLQAQVRSSDRSDSFAVVQANFSNTENGRHGHMGFSWGDPANQVSGRAEEGRWGRAPLPEVGHECAAHLGTYLHGR